MPDWHAALTPLTAIEVLLKFIAICVGVASLSEWSSEPVELSGVRVGIAVCLCIVGAVYLVRLGQRALNEKDLIQVIFSVLQVISHILVIGVSFAAAKPGDFIFTYAFLYILGEYIRLLSQVIENVAPEADSWFQKPVLLVLSAVQLVIYLIVMSLQLAVLITEY